MSDGLDAIEQLAGTLLRKASAPERRRILREFAREVRAGQSARIGRQQEPDGHAFTPRRPRKADATGAFAVKFLYPKGAAEPRLVFMKSWVRQGPLLTGYDVEAGGIRSFFWDKVAEWLPVESADQNKRGGKFRRQGAVRRGAMFRKLRSARYLKAGSTADEAWVGWIDPAVSRVARVHQDGGSDRPAAHAKPVRYARRMLIGLGSFELNALVGRLLGYIAE